MKQSAWATAVPATSLSAFSQNFIRALTSGVLVKMTSVSISCVREEVDAKYSARFDGRTLNGTRLKGLLTLG